MPAQKRPLESTAPPPSPPPPPLEDEKVADSLKETDNQSQQQLDNDSDSDASSESSGEVKDEFTVVKLAELRKEVQCPICLGIIRKTRTVMECLHRFCRECIDKSMRLGNNECPACRTHCASRRSLRDDPNYDALIAALYPDIDKYEEEELAFSEEEKARNRQIQDLIAETFRRQAEELGKKRTSTRTTAATFARRQSYRNLRGRRNHRVAEHQGSDEEEGATGQDSSKDSSSSDEHSVEVKSKRYKRRVGGRRTSKPSSGANANGGFDDNDSEANRELVGASAGFVGSKEILAWGRGGLRSNNRHGGLNGGKSKFSRNNRLSKLMDRLRCNTENDEALNISVTLVSLHEEKIPSLKRPYLSCSHTLSVKHLCQYVAMQTSREATEIEMLVIKDFRPINNSVIFNKELSALDTSHNELQLLNEHQTLGEIHASFTEQNLVLSYRQKVQGSGN